MLILFWIVGSFIAGMIGSDKSIGFFGAFFLSLILSPLIGIIAALMSKSDSEVRREKKMLQTQLEQEKSLKKISEQNTQIATFSISEEILRLKDLQDKGIISEEEFEVQKKKLLGQ